MITEGVDLSGLHRLGRRAARPGGGVTGNPLLDMDRLIDDRRTRIIVCCGSGGAREDHRGCRDRAAGRGTRQGNSAYSPSTPPAGSPSRWA